MSAVLLAYPILSCHSQEAPQIEVVGNQDYCVGSAVPIVTSVSINNSSGVNTTLDNVFIQIAEGYEVNQDLIFLNGSFPNITPTWSVEQGVLTLSGPASFSEFEDAIASVFFQTSQTEFTADRAFSINLSSANFLPSNGHYYIYIQNVGITWSEALNAAENQELFGIQGYLATLTTEEEAQLAGAQSEGTGWIGASDAEQESNWKWVTGPEAGTLFWIGQFNGTPQNGAFAFWNTNEPNNFGEGGEDYAHITDPSIGNIGSWNDLPNQGDAPGSPYHPQGYIVEFGGMPGDPEISLSAGSTLNMPRIEINSSNACGNLTAELSVTSNAPNVIWYETETSNTVINEGLTYNVDVEDTTTFWLLPKFDGCTVGPRFPLTVEVFPTPEAVDIDIVQCDDETQDGLTIFNLNDFKGLITNGATNRDVNFYTDVGLTNLVDGESFNNTSNPQTVFAEVIDTVSGCSAIAQVYLETSLSSSSSATLEQCDNQIENGMVTFDLSMADNQVLNGLSPDFVVNYYFDYQDALFEDSPLINDYVNVEPYLQTVYARIEDNGNCYSIAEVILKVIELPEIQPDETVYYCLDDFPETITLNGGVIDDIPNNYYYTWSTGETTIEIEINEPGVYTVDVAPVNGCPKTRTITVLPSNIATIDDITVTDLADNNSIQVQVSGEGVYEFALDNEFGPWQSSNTFENLNAGIYKLYVRDVLNDCGIVSKDVSVVGYPRFFSPNGDGFNDFWQLSGISEQFQPNSEVFIFDRFGKVLFTMTSHDQVWDGTYNGTLMPTSDYWFFATLQDGRDFRGHFTLKR